MQFFFTRHARNALRLYGLTTADVEAVIMNPFRREVDSKGQGRMNVWGQAADGRWIMAVYVEEQRVVTAQRLTVTLTVVITVELKRGLP